MTVADPEIRIDGVTLRYETADEPVLALSDVSLSVRRNEFVSVVGPSGCGKTSLLKLISGLTAPTEGGILVRGESPERARERQDFGFVFQSPVLLPWRTVRQNVELSLEVARRDMSGEERRRVALGLLEKTDLRAFADRRPTELSGGMQQRVALARAMATSPSILLMDEPFAALDEIAREAMQNELLELWTVLQSTIVFITHSLSEAILLSDRVVVMSSRPGRILTIIDVGAERPRSGDFRDSAHFVQLLREARAALAGGFARERSAVA